MNSNPLFGAVVVAGALTAVLTIGCASTSPNARTGRTDVGSTSPVQTGENSRAVLHGRALTTDGRPVPNVHIAIYGGIATRWRVGGTDTNAAGEYCFDPLPGGAMMENDRTGQWDWYVGMTIDHPDYASADGLSWWDVTVERGKTQRHDFTMQPAGALSATLLGADGRPAPGVNLRICSPDGHRTNFIRYATMNLEGQIAEHGLAPADYVVEINDGPYPRVGSATIRAGETTTASLHTAD